MNYDYEAKGYADHKAGKRDEKLYNLTDLVPGHGVQYRNGWRRARLEAERERDGIRTAEPHPAAAVVVETPADVPPWASEAPPQPAVGAHVTLAPGVDQLAGTASEKTPASKTAGSDAEQPRPAPSISRESVRLAAGEDKPRKPKKPEPSPQLDLFS